MFNYNCGRTLPELFDYFHIKLQDRDKIKNTLTKEGYTVLGICYGAAKSEAKLLRYASDPRLPNIFMNEVRKNAFKPGDARWETKEETAK